MRRLGPILVLLLAASGVEAQSFRDAAEEASEIPGELRRFGAPLFDECDQGSSRDRSRCQRSRRRDVRSLRAGRWLVSEVATGHVEVGPYETVREGFAVRIPDLELQANGGLLTTRVPTERGRYDRQVIAERFFVVAPDRAERWFSRNALDRLRIRLVLSFGEAWERGDQKGVLIEVHAIQVYNASTGSVLMDSTDQRAVPPGPPDLDRRVLLWDRSTVREARWRAPSGEAVLFSVEVTRDEDGTQTAVLHESRGITRREVGRFSAPCCDASLAMIPRAQTGVMVVFTESRPGEGRTGAGQVHLFEWRGDALETAATWSGTNEQTPPVWVRDETAPIPSG